MNNLLYEGDTRCYQEVIHTGKCYPNRMADAHFSTAEEVVGGRKTGKLGKLLS